MEKFAGKPYYRRRVVQESMLQLRPVLVSDESAFKRAVRAFASSDPDWDFAFHFDEDDDFAVYVGRLDSWSKGRNLPDTFVPNTFLVAVVGDEVVGRVSIRHVLNEFLLKMGGHVGYGVVASHRRKGYATEMLRRTLPLAKSLGIQRLLITCDDDNIGSSRAIESNGGVLENVVYDPELQVSKRRYWIEL